MSGEPRRAISDLITEYQLLVEEAHRQQVAIQGIIQTTAELVELAIQRKSQLMVENMLLMSVVTSSHGEDVARLAGGGGGAGNLGGIKIPASLAESLLKATQQQGGAAAKQRAPPVWPPAESPVLRGPRGMGSMGNLSSATTGSGVAAATARKFVAWD